MLRGALLPGLLVIAYLAVNVLRRPSPEPTAARGADLTRARRLIERGEQSLANAALRGDKRLLFAAAGEAFLAYQIAGHTWVALGDPLGARPGVEALMWRFCQMADRHGGQPVFYQTGSRWLARYEDLGLAPLPIGAQARVPLEQFALSGPDRAGLRHNVRRARRAGLSFEIRMPPAPRALLMQLRAVSDAWLTAHATAERGFSVGAFAPRYLRRFPLAVVRRAGEPIAFANLWPAGDRREIAFDLIRFAPAAPRGTMSYLLTETLLWARSQGYRWGNLGMAPLAEPQPDALAPAWHRAGQFVFPQGEQFDHLEQMRPYFERFTPRWETRYLLAPAGIALPRVLLEVAHLIAEVPPRVPAGAPSRPAAPVGRNGL
jgi:phosphatidylglycerol lysyltransferase